MKMMILASMLVMACAAPQAPIQAQKVCKRYCTNSKACGDSCIPWENACHKPEGSACTVIVHQ